MILLFFFNSRFFLAAGTAPAAAQSPEPQQNPAVAPPEPTWAKKHPPWDVDKITLPESPASMLPLSVT
jgi:hypothetical protein